MTMSKRNRDQNWKTLVGNLKKFDKDTRDGIFGFGDTMCQIEDQYGRDALEEAAQEAGVKWQQARQRWWLCRNIPPTSKLRTLTLSFSAYRALARLEPELQLRLAQEMIAGDWTVEQLKLRISGIDPTRVADNAPTCALEECPTRIADGMTPIYVRIGSGKMLPCCCEDHAIELLTERPTVNLLALANRLLSRVMGQAA